MFLPTKHRFALANVWSQLPIELIREIILYLASTDRGTARSLRLVCRNTNIWVLPLLFRSVTFTSTEQIIRFASTLLPKRKIHIPALKSELHNSPRPLSTYSIHSLALVVNTRLPSVETALANVAPAFSQLKTLFITSKNLSSNGHWLRLHPIRPTTIVLLHFGSPHLVNYRDPIFECVTHLYTSTLTGYRDSHVTDPPNVTHIAVHTRLDHPFSTIASITAEFLRILKTAPQLQLFVFTFDDDCVSSEKIAEWNDALDRCLQDRRFIVLPHFRLPRMEWECLLRGQPSVWERALKWLAIQEKGDSREILRYRAETIQRLGAEKAWLAGTKRHVDWEIDLVQREDYVALEADSPSGALYSVYTNTPYPKLQYGS